MCYLPMFKTLAMLTKFCHILTARLFTIYPVKVSVFSVSISCKVDFVSNKEIESVYATKLVKLITLCDHYQNPHDMSFHYTNRLYFDIFIITLSLA